MWGKTKQTWTRTQIETRTQTQTGTETETGKKTTEERTGTELEKVSSVSLVSKVSKLLISGFTDGCISVFLGNISAFLEVIRWVAPKNANTNGSFP
jgi:hypothetical protein